MIELVGLGCSPADISEGAKAALRAGARVILRTGETPAAAWVRAQGVSFETLDGVYARSRNFDSLNKNLAAAVLEAAKGGDVIYCVDGSVADDVSAQMVLRRGKDVRVHVGVSKADAAFAAAKVFSRDRTALSAYAIGESGRPMLPLAVYDVDCDLIAGDVKLRLCELFGDEAEATFVRGGAAKKVRLFELEHTTTCSPSCACCARRTAARGTACRRTRASART